MEVRAPGPASSLPEGGEQLNLSFELKALNRITEADGSEAGVFEGLASTFGEHDLLDDVIEPGAFGDSLEAPRRIKMLWQHDASQPIGIWERLAESDRGLLVRGRLILDVRRAFEAWALLRSGAVDALSIGFRVPQPTANQEIETETGVRRIKRLDLWEISIVTFPANPRARVERIKGCSVPDLQSKRDLEAALRTAGFTGSVARYVAARWQPPAGRIARNESSAALADHRRQMAAIRARLS